MNIKKVAGNLGFESCDSGGLLCMGRKEGMV